MAALCWISVMVIFCLSAATLAEMNLTRLADLVQQIRTDIKQKNNINTMYAAAVSIPKDPNQVSYDLKKVMTSLQTWWDKDQDILRSARLVVATKKDVTTKRVKYTEHAEWRVLQDLNLEGQKGDLLLFFSFASPCNEKCANPEGNYRITDELKSLFDSAAWGEKAFVFEVLFRPRSVTYSDEKMNSENISSALTNIGNAIGLRNVFRCYGSRCISCVSGNQINQNCIS